MSFRIKAFLIHLVISCVIAVLSMSLVFFVWHPDLLAKAVGVTSIFVMMIAIDSILGPLLTLAVAKEGKKSLKFDLSVIALLQLLALAVGIYTISTTRPVYVVFDSERFEIIQANQIAVDDLANADSPYNKISWGKPNLVAVKEAMTEQEKNDRMIHLMTTGVSASMRPNMYQSIDKHTDVIIKNAESLSKLKEFNEARAVGNIINKYPNAIGWLPVRSYTVSMTMLVDKDCKLNMVDLRPWDE